VWPDRQAERPERELRRQLRRVVGTDENFDQRRGPGGSGWALARQRWQRKA